MCVCVCGFGWFTCDEAPPKLPLKVLTLKALLEACDDDVLTVGIRPENPRDINCLNIS